MLLQVRDAEFRYGEVTVFRNINLEVNERDSIGLVGGNGAGKSTLLKCLVGELSLFSGEIYKKNGLTLGYLKQNADFLTDKTLFDEMMTVFAYETNLIEQIKRTAEEMASVSFDGGQYRALADKYHRLSVEADVRQAYDSEVKVKTVLSGMGMTPFSDRYASTLSGGEKTKAALCKMLLIRPELMILDEPTNHLDYKTLDWLESYLADKKSALIVVSHDRYFLDKLCGRVWDMENGSVTAYNGNYTKYKTLKAERSMNLRRAYDKQQKEIAKLQDYIDRNKVRASTADMAKSREKKLEKMELVELPPSAERPPRFRFSYTTEPSEKVLNVRNFTAGFDGRTLMDKVSLEIVRGSRTALLGLNGTGKSTLLKRVAANSPSDAASIIFGKNVRYGYYDQENLNLDGQKTVLEQLWFDNTRMSQTEVRSLLASVNLGADDVYKKVSDLSGGERAKLGLAMLMAKDCNFLILDEPTNHLDLPSREALEEALSQYRGTLLFVSHDRYFVNGIAGSIAELENGRLTVSQGNYDDFAAGKKKEVPPCGQAAVSVKKTEYRNARQRADETNRAKKIKELEKRLTQLEADEKTVTEEISLPEVAADYRILSDALNQLEEIKREYENTLAEWECLMSE